MSSSELFAGHELLRRMDRGGTVEFHEARALAAPQETRLIIRFPPDETRYMPWAWPEVAKYIVHPNVLRMYDFRVIEGRATAILEFVPGADLREVIQTERLPVGLSCFIVREACKGLAAGLSASAPGGPLRATLGSLCPRNIHLSRTGDIKVGPYSLGRLKPEGDGFERLDERLLFLAPEQATGKVCDSPGPEVDVFVAGAVLQQLLAGTPLGIPAKTPEEYVWAVIRAPHRSFFLRHLSVSSQLANVLDKALAREPTERFREASEVAAAHEAVPELIAVQVTARGELARLVSSVRSVGTLGAR